MKVQTLPEESAVMRVELSSPVAPARSAVEKPRTIEFLYLDQEAVLAADLLNMPRAMREVGRAQALFAQGQVRHPHKVVLRQEDSAASEDQGRFNALFASIGGAVRDFSATTAARLPPALSPPTAIRSESIDRSSACATIHRVAA